MTRTIRSLIIGITLSLGCVACTVGEGESAASPPSSPQDVPLQRLEEISLEGDPLSDMDSGPKPEKRQPVGEIHMGSHRIIAYVEGRKCGLLVINSAKGTPISLKAEWPQDADRGSSHLPAGPYRSSSASGSSASDPWASLSCGKKAMIVEYAPKASERSSAPHGSIAVANSRKSSSSFIVVGPKDVRADILNKLSADLKSG
ncbi:hypothetical protein AB0K71_28935 [Streptomyces syringium]|uniref:hypothetical protein n=1 Tax=Streptomyces syringium TaxID=76729 RepID=UPI003428A758